MTKILILTFTTIAALQVATHIRGVGAEDDCSINTVSVAHVPYVGLVCIWESTPQIAGSR